MNRRALIGVFAAAFLAAGLVSSPVGVRAGEKVDIEKKIAEAKTPADHEAIAAYFDKEAKHARAAAKYHSEMGESYKKMGGALIEKQHADKHCDAITAGYEAIAKENEDLAAAHRAMAKAAGH
jgi:hypothetical protein